MITSKGKQIMIKKGDITEEKVDAIVNPANGQLIHGGGAAKAIVTKGGDEIQRESNLIIRKTGMIPTGKAVITGSGKLPCKFIIHTVGPKMGEGSEEIKLKKAIWSALTLAELYNLETVSMPAVSSGIFGFPKDKCADILLKTSAEFFDLKDINLKTIIMCNRDDETYNIFLQKYNSMK
jgi:O-acetyl-ADP-ribose deacetylase